MHIDTSPTRYVTVLSFLVLGEESVPWHCVASLMWWVPEMLTNHISFHSESDTRGTSSPHPWHRSYSSNDMTWSFTYIRSTTSMWKAELQWICAFGKQLFIYHTSFFIPLRSTLLSTLPGLANPQCLAPFRLTNTGLSQYLTFQPLSFNHPCWDHRNFQSHFHNLSHGCQK